MPRSQGHSRRSFLHRIALFSSTARCIARAASFRRVAVDCSRLSLQAFSFYPIAALRAAVVDGWENKVFAELKGFFASDSRHVMLSETRVVKLGDGFVETNRPNEGFGTRIDFDVRV